VRTPKECAAYMASRYGKDAGIHCMYAIMNNYDNEYAQAYWREVDQELVKLKKDGEKN
jgi:hypothetical protein